MAAAFSRPEDFVLAPTAKPAGMPAKVEATDDLAAFLRRSSVDGYAVADRMADVVRAKDDSGGALPEDRDGQPAAAVGPTDQGRPRDPGLLHFAAGLLRHARRPTADPRKPAWRSGLGA